MGRYINGDLDYKFWFATQPSSDILEWGEEYNNPDITPVRIKFDDLKELEENLDKIKANFKKSFKITYEKFMSIIDKQGYVMSSSDKETNTKLWDNKCREASRIDLGIKVIKALKEKQDDLFLEAEN